MSRKSVHPVSSAGKSASSRLVGGQARPNSGQVANKSVLSAGKSTSSADRPVSPAVKQVVDKILISKQKISIIGLLIVILNPLPAGLIYGLAFRRDPFFKEDSKMLIIFSLLWGGILLALANRYFS
jgi:hypothetical protein